MVESGGRPAVRGMTRRAIKSEASIVRLVPAMTGIAVLQSHLEIVQPARIKVAFYTFQSDMPAGDLERKLIMIEIRDQAIDAIVTSETIGAKRQRMCRHKDHIHFAVTGIAGGQVEYGDVVAVTIRTGKRFVPSCKLVTV